MIAINPTFRKIKFNGKHSIEIAEMRFAPKSQAGILKWADNVANIMSAA
ncbi:hypothetical protein DLJ48_08650 [Oenococcus sicerae]|uniref:Uncharacterized protein n=1 Tax=Oenococcus sicerae TaxID=2203724 RepID=A0ABX6J3U6_9LACO|nr:hypothetical protein [Oenococcus sicerae]QHW12506.1 hypothetical protein DLJ48_08650 [Oenococcus sicerae]VDK14842.1 hypothetical protein OAL24_01577 [Oenococcus sicerae]